MSQRFNRRIAVRQVDPRFLQSQKSQIRPWRYRTLRKRQLGTLRFLFLFSRLSLYLYLYLPFLRRDRHHPQRQYRIINESRLQYPMMSMYMGTSHLRNFPLDLLISSFSSPPSLSEFVHSLLPRWMLSAPPWHNRLVQIRKFYFESTVLILVGTSLPVSPLYS